MRFEYVHNLRGLAILLILLGHAIAVLPSTQGIGDLRYLIVNNTVLFIVIPGFLFAAIGERYTYKDYLLNKVKNVLLPYVFLSLPAALIYILGYKTTHLWLDMEFFNQLPAIAQYSYLLITGAHLGPLWFIPMIVVFYFAFPFFITMLHVKKTYLVGIFAISLCIGMYLGRPEHNDNIIQSFFYFLPAYLWGIILFKVPDIIQYLKKYSVLWLTLYVGLAVMFFTLNGYSSSSDLAFKLVFSTLLYSLFACYLDRKISMLNVLAQVSFFLFFIHGYFAGALRLTLKSNPVDINNIVLLLGVFVVILALSLISFYILRPFAGKYKRQLLGSS